jgi:hypothetical protein
MPFREKERDRLARLMSVDQVMKVGEYHEDGETKRKRKWKEIRHICAIIIQPPYFHKSLENALWFYGHRGITVNHFIMAMVNEFRFDNALHIDTHLRWLYWSFDGGSNDDADWRDILAAFKVVIFFRLVKNKPHALLVILFDIFAEGGKTPNDHPNDSWYLSKPDAILLRIFLIPCESEGEVLGMEEMLKHVMGKARKGEGRMTRRQFKDMLKSPVASALVENWKGLAWHRMPVDLRLKGMDEAQMNAQYACDVIMVRIKMQQALAMCARHIYRHCFKEWRCVLAYTI